MTLFPDTGGDPRAAVARAADVLAWYGALGDAVVGNPPGFAVRKASLAHALCEIANVPESERNAAYLAGLLHAVGAIGNASFRKGERLPDRYARMESWDVPAQGARLAEDILALPPETPDIIRWQSECWDGTGHPDQLRWHGIPLTAQMLGLADTFLRQPDPEEALGFIGMQSGRAFSPDAARTFTMWFHTNAGEVTSLPTPVDALRNTGLTAGEMLDAFADRIDEHNGVAKRWRHVADLAMGAAAQLKLDANDTSSLALAAHLFGAGELTSSSVEDTDFDPLARLGVEARAANAKRAADVAEPFEALRAAAVIVRSRGEWYDGMGKPAGLRHEHIPAGSSVLAAAIAYERLARNERIDTASGTQFDPTVVRALMESARAHA
jgi:response regulator RpfG family c-di-GMP phosphodiesterase